MPCSRSRATYSLGNVRTKPCVLVRELTPYGWKAKWQPVVEAHRASILERLMQAADA